MASLEGTPGYRRLIYIVLVFLLVYVAYSMLRHAAHAGSHGDSSASIMTVLTLLFVLGAFAISILFMESAVVRVSMDGDGIGLSKTISGTPPGKEERWPWRKVQKMPYSKGSDGSMYVRLSMRTFRIAVGLEPAALAEIIEFADRMRSMSAQPALRPDKTRQ